MMFRIIHFPGQWNVAVENIKATVKSGLKFNKKVEIVTDDEKYSFLECCKNFKTLCESTQEEVPPQLLTQ